MNDVIPITSKFVPGTSVNCYLVKTGDGCVLIDSGMPNKRRSIEKELVRRDCRPGDLKLIVITHGDKDHCGNAAYLRGRYGAIIAMHRDDSGMVEWGDMFWNRKAPNAFLRTLFGRLMGLSMSDRFAPDICVEDGNDFSAYGFDATVLHLPGHSKGSIGVLTKDGDLFCGDLLANTRRPSVWSIIDDRAAADASVRRLTGMTVGTVYPGHGRPFPMKTLVNA